MKNLSKSFFVLFMMGISLVMLGQGKTTGNMIKTDAGVFIEFPAPNTNLPESRETSITTFFAANNSYAGNMFDVEVIGGNDIVINSFDLNLYGAPVDIYFYYKIGTYVGFENTSGAWTLVGIAPLVNPLGINVPTPVNLGGITLEAGQVYGFYLTTTAMGLNPPSLMYYTNGNNTFSDANLRITAGIGLGGDTHFDDLFIPRTWNGTIYYDLGGAVPVSGWALGIGILLIVSLVVIRYMRMS